MAGVLVALFTLLCAVLVLAAGLSWRSLLHWAGETCLLLGICCAAACISQVRRAWTCNRGIAGSAVLIWHRSAGLLRAALIRPPAARWLTRRLGLHLRLARRLQDSAEPGTAATMARTAGPAELPGPDSLPLEDRVSILERRLEAMLQQASAPDAAQRPAPGPRGRSRAGQQERPCRASVAALAGVLRLQASAVTLLLAGILLTAIW